MRTRFVWLLCCIAVPVGAEKAPESATERLHAAIARHQQDAEPPRTIAEHLQRLVILDPEFDANGGSVDALAPAMRVQYEGLEPLLDIDLRDQLLGLSSDSLRAEWIRRYWVLRDPTPTTPENERLLEHQQRESMARDQFGISGSTSFDDRGRFFILYGPPSGASRWPPDVQEGLGYIPERLYWFYPDGVVVAFERRNPPQGPWLIGISAKGFTSRTDVLRAATRGFADEATGFGLPATYYDPDRVPIEATSPMAAAEAELALVRARGVWEKRLERFEVPGAPARFLWFVFDTDVFRASGGTSDAAPLRLEAHVQWSLQDLTYVWRDSLYTARYRLEGILFDEELREAGRDTYEMDLNAKRFDSTQLTRLWPGQLDFAVRPGLYRLTLRLVDLGASNTGTYTTDVMVADLVSPRLALSDIQLATSIAPAGEYAGSRFVKNDRLVLPNPIALYTQRQFLTAYFEIYGLTLEANQRARYRVSYQILPQAPAARGKRRHAKPRATVTSSFITEAALACPVEELRIDVSELPEGIFELLISLTDLVGGGETVAQTRFSILRL